MAVAYIDSSCLVALALGERESVAIGRRLLEFEQLISSNLLEAEVRSVMRRESETGVEVDLASMTWMDAPRPLSREIARVLTAGYVRGADCWHLATALHLAPEPSDLTFLTLDKRQRSVAKALGFAT